MSKIKTLFHEIDELLNANNGEGKLIALGSRPGMGKTTFVMNLAKNIAELNDVKILFFSLEESKEKLYERFFENTHYWLHNSNKIYIDEVSSPSIDYIEKRISQCSNPSIVIIDYIALIKDFTSGFQNEILSKLKSICKIKNINIIYTCQLDRKLEMHADKRPRLSNFDDFIIDTSDAVFALYREAYYCDDDDRTAELRLIKNLMGGTHLIPLLYDAKNSLFYSESNYEFDAKQQKRVELNLHTKMSDVISTIDVSDAFRFAENCNQKAIAFTNLNNVQDFPKIRTVSKKYKNIKPIYGMQVYYEENGCGAPSMTLLAKNKDGVRELYKIVSSMWEMGNTKVTDIDYIEANRKNLLCGATGDMSALYYAVASDKPFEKIVDIAKCYDYFEIFPTNDLYSRRVYEKIVDLGEELCIPVVATGNCFCYSKDDETSRDVIKKARGYRYEDEPMYLRNTQDMLKEFVYLGEEKAYEIVVKNTNLIADMIENTPSELIGYRFIDIDDADNLIKSITKEQAQALYGEILPKQIEERINEELSLILDGGFSSIYLTAYYIAKYVNEKGYCMMSRGDIASSFVAYLLKITENNPLKSHYLCKKCKHLDFSSENVYSGFDLPLKRCPICGEKMSGDGHNIPYEMLMGIKGDKIPDISLNVPCSVKNDVINHLCELFGKEKLAFAGSISKIFESKTERYISLYEELEGKEFSDSEKIDIICQTNGIKNKEEVHPARIFILPKNEDFLSYTPLKNHRVENCLLDKVTHFDFHDLYDTITKINLLGYKPMEHLALAEKYTGINRNEIDLTSPEIYSLFRNSDVLGIDSDEPGTLGIPEFSVKVVKEILNQVQPNSFGELVKISGLSHGTNTWFNNAKDLLKNENATIKEVAATREDVFSDLVSFGIDRYDAFKIAQSVRKGLFAKNKIDKENSDNLMNILNNSNAPDWYIHSIIKVFYMFPKAHAVEYVRIAVMLAWFKIHYPTEFYAAYFEVYMKEEKYNFLPLGFDGIALHLDRIKSTLGTGGKYAEEMEKMSIFEECFFRGIKFIYRKENDSTTYIPTKEKTIAINRNNGY